MTARESTRRAWNTCLIVAMLLTASSAGAGAQSKKAMTERSLYDRLGGKAAIVAVVDAFVGQVAADARISGFFAATAADATRLADFKAKLVDQICEASGGPCKYKGHTMKEAHMGLGVRGVHFDALVEDLVWALDKFKVGKAEKDQLLGVLGPMKADIVEAK